MDNNVAVFTTKITALVIVSATPCRQQFGTFFRIIELHRYSALTFLVFVLFFCFFNLIDLDLDLVLML